MLSGHDTLTAQFPAISAAAPFVPDGKKEQKKNPGRDRSGRSLVGTVPPGSRESGVCEASIGGSGGAGLDDEFLAKHAQCRFDAGHGSTVPRVEHAAHNLLVDAEALGEGYAGHAGFA